MYLNYTMRNLINKSYCRPIAVNNLIFYVEVQTLKNINHYGEYKLRWNVYYLDSN